MLAYVSPALAGVFCAAFLGYEIAEEVRIRDRCWIDLAGYLWGLAIGGGIWYLWVVVP